MRPLRGNIRLIVKREVKRMELEELIYTYSDYLYRIAYSYVKDEQAAEEVVQDVFFKFYKTSAHFEGTAHIKTYLTRMIINRSYDYLRSWKHKKNTIFEVFHQKINGVDIKAIEQEEETTIWQSILSLPVKYRETIILYYYEDLSIKEIADMLFMAESTIKSRLQRARALLKTSLQDTEWEVLRHE